MAYALVLTVLAWRSALGALLPVPLEPIPLGLYVWGGVLVALVPALVTPRSPLGAMMPAWVAAVAVAAYDQSHLDWLRTLKNFDVVDPGTPDIARIALAAGALLLAWLTHAVDLAARLRRDLARRGVPAGEARAAGAASLRRTLGSALAATLGFVGIVGVGLMASAVDVAFGRVTFLMPLVAAGLIAAAALLLTSRDKSEGAGSEAAEATTQR